MNETINGILNHRSIRSFTNQSIDPDHLEAIYACAQAAPSSINGQQMSIIVVTDQAKKDLIAQYAGGQAWISQAPVFLVFAMDYHRAALASEKNNQVLVIPQNEEGVLVASIDVGLAMGNAIAAAESLGLGTVCIGGIRNNPQDLIDLLELPQHVYPLVGLCLGHPNTQAIPQKKPRFPREAVVHHNTYDANLSEKIDLYDQVIVNYMTERTQGQNVHSWSSAIANTYNRVYFPKVTGTLKSQGFLTE